MNLDEIKKLLQDHLTDGLVTIVGSGLSASCGLPTVGRIASDLIKYMPDYLKPAIVSQWEIIAKKLTTGMGLEEALNDIDSEADIIPVIVGSTSEFIERDEAIFIKGVFEGRNELPFADLLKSLTFNNERVVVITSNYDRLIEFAAEISGYGVDTCFTGQHYGHFDPKACKESLGIAVQTHKHNNIKRIYRKHIAIYKPHGSLDWYEHNGNPVRCTLPIDAPRLIITPGKSKYRLGYNSPFDYHRNAANEAIDKAARYLIVVGSNSPQLAAVY